MQASQTRTSSPEVPSSPPAASLQQGGRVGTEDEQRASSPAQTLVTAPSPTQTLGHSSPELPPLPYIPALGGVPRTPATIARHPATDTTYYTASWGSPYQNPPPNFNIQSSPPKLRSILDSDDIEENSPGPQFGLDHLLPSRLEEPPHDFQFGLEHLLPHRLSTSQATPTRPGLHTHQSAPEITPRPLSATSNRASKLPSVGATEDWVRQYLASRWTVERGNWWSDESGDSEGSIQSEGTRDTSRRNTATKRTASIKGHKSRKDNLTLKQADFWKFFDGEPMENFDKMMLSKHASPQPPLSAPELDTQPKSVSRLSSIDKPLPPPPMSKDPTLSNSSPENATNLPRSSSVPATSPTALPLRKSIKWRGKSCVIQIPADVPRSDDGTLLYPLSVDEVAARLERFKQAGYEIGGFDHYSQEPGNSIADAPVQNCAIFPDPTDDRSDHTKGSFRVHIPNKSEWEAYVKFLTEQKLRALGVTLGDEEPEVIAPPRRMSSQRPILPFSPPLPTLSANSRGIGQSGGINTIPFQSGPPSRHQSTRSVASPLSAYGNPRALHMHRHSTFASPPGFASQLPTPPGPSSFSPQHYFAHQGGARGGSPAFSNGRPDPGQVVSPGSLYGSYGNQASPFVPREDLMLQIQQQQPLLQTQLQQQQQQNIFNVRPTSTLKEVPEDEEEDDLPSKPKQATQPDPTIAVPTPRGHHHNISASLEREIRDAEYHLERSIDRQLDEDSEFSPEARFGIHDAAVQPTGQPGPHMNGNPWPKTSAAQQTLHQPQPHSRTQSLTHPGQPNTVDLSSQGANLPHSEMSDSTGTNPSEADINPRGYKGHISRSSFDHKQNGFPSTDQADHESGPPFRSSQFETTSNHAPKTSVSKLNVTAKEFTFNPGAVISGPLFRSSNTKPLVSNPLARPHRNNASPTGGLYLGQLGNGFNVTAPTLQPGRMGHSAVPTGSFSFLPTGSTHKPNVPVLQTGNVPGPVLDANSLSSSAVSDMPNRIFGNVTLNPNDIVKPVRKSKAVPIVRPSSSREHQDEEVHYDTEGRLAQSDARQKRAKHGADDGDDVPQFASPSNPLDELSAGPMKATDTKEDQDDPPVNTENMTTNKADIEPLPPAASLNCQDVPESLSAHIEPQLKSELASVKAVISDHAKESSIDSGTLTEMSQPFKRTHQLRSSLSATAKPFEFNPSVERSSEFGLHITKPSVNQSDEITKTLGSPPPPSSRSPATTFPHSDDGSYRTAVEGRKMLPYPDSDAVDYESYVQPTFNEIDEVMKHLNEEGSDFGVERDGDSWEQSSPRAKSPHQFERLELRPPNHFRSDAPSPSPRRLYPPVPPNDSASLTNDPFDEERAALAYESPVHRLNNLGDVPVSDWDDVVSSNEEDKIQPRSRFFDSHVDRVVDGVLQSRLGPLEQALRSIQNSVNAMSQRRSNRSMRRSSSMDRRLDSDADDEDDDDLASPQLRTRSPWKDRKLEKIRSIVQDALTAQASREAPAERAFDFTQLSQAIADLKVSTAQTSEYAKLMSAGLSPADFQLALEELKSSIEESVQRMGDTHSVPCFDPKEFYQALADLRSSVAQTTSVSLQLEDIKGLVEDAFSRQHQAVVFAKQDEKSKEDAPSVSDLDRMLKEAADRMDGEVKARHAAERREADTQKLLKLAEEEIELFKESSRDDCQKMRALEDECHVSRQKIAAANTALEELRQSRTELSAENKALEDTLDEYRISSSKWRDDIDQANEDREALKKSMSMLKLQIEEATRVRELMRSKLETIQLDMAAAAGQVADEKARWQKADEEHRTRYEVLTARVGAEAATRERLERELERLEMQEQDAIKARLVLEETRRANVRLEETVNALRLESLAHQKNAERFEREFQEAREAGRNEVQRTRVLMEADVEAANNQVNIVRADLEIEMSRLRVELENVRLDADTGKARYEMLLEGEADAKRGALRDALDDKSKALQEQQQKFERHLDDLQSQHSRTIHNALEDRQRSETYLQESLSLSQAKVDHLQDKILHLEEKLEIAKSAAQAAAQAAQTAKAPAGAALLPQPPDRISTQALRESINVLQEQLQDRERRIESLDEQLNQVDASAPAKLKERDTEITWLRELLGVRLDDLSDLINALSQPTFDRDTVRDAAIRIRTNLQMEQQEKERLVSGSQTFPTLASISNFASPKAVQLAAAFGNWRNKGRETAASALAQSTNNTSSSASTSRAQTPSKTAPSAQNFLSGLMTPPTSNLRRTPSPTPAAVSGILELKQGRGRPARRLEQPAALPALSVRQQEKQAVAAPLTTPPLMRESSYDQDAEDGEYSTNGFYDDEGSTVDGNLVDGVEPLQAFGPGLGGAV
ncbi:hypothetical protein W97_00405 [Coniosporium apollinis CBS 100218]|uniref:Myosin class II heavy chain n=1 Tax=Coniosporium apollinis (strain CBS 100218) TaxID=1168221 RepID=R7YH31_CONA1|nr:uncharacterized protein W97_00405 [Coniosporium apollinis CBS 100218]EON61193.1 hypothetical protein W97_00405 [Coniosporium apollinis CBS 100218]